MASRALWDDTSAVNRHSHTRRRGRGKPIRHIDMLEAAFREGLQAGDLPPPLIEMQVEYCAAVKESRAALVTHEVEHCSDGRHVAT